MEEETKKNKGLINMLLYLAMGVLVSLIVLVITIFVGR